MDSLVLLMMHILNPLVGFCVIVDFHAGNADCAKRMKNHLKTAFKMFQPVFDFMDAQEFETAGGCC